MNLINWLIFLFFSFCAISAQSKRNKLLFLISEKLLFLSLLVFSSSSIFHQANCRHRSTENKINF